ncbi:MAG: 16S rRNA (uracil(1498)-N(3))-methyltransferase [Parachlamydiaceae bacterium]|nr:16S rRNA (uracil(1498)-N(3))-methyltransferase [Parachlamydiaceae bacterium]
MPVERFYSPQEFTPQQNLVLEETEFHHLAHVVRIQVGEEVELVNGAGALARATVRTLQKKSATLEIIAVSKQQPAQREVILAQAVTRLSRLDFILEKGTELGMTQLWLFPGDRSDRKGINEVQVGRMAAVTIAAMKQCGRLFLPKIVLKEALARWEIPPYVSFFGDVAPEAPGITQFLQQQLQKDVLFYIGPESGFSDNEQRELQRLKARGVKLHSNILRADTAALVALAAITVP